MLFIPPIMSSIKMELIIKNSNTKQLHHNTIIYPIQIKNIKNVYKRNIENKIITIKI